MKKFKLIKEYPGLKIDTIVQYQPGVFPEYFDINSAKRYCERDIENYPEFWQEIKNEYPKIISIIEKGRSEILTNWYDINSWMKGYLS